MRLRKLSTSAMLLGLCAASYAAPPVYPIPGTAVAHAIFAVHPELVGSAIDVPSAVAAHAQNPALEAGPLEHWAGAGTVAHVRLRCIHPGDCLPFYAAVRTPSAQSAQNQILPAQPPPNYGSETAVHSGAHVFLLIDSGRLHLRLPATVLGSGVAGSTVRVAGPARGKVYEALVVDSTTVRGSL